jgi:hypothetical protein
MVVGEMEEMDHNPLMLMAYCPVMMVLTKDLLILERH